LGDIGIIALAQAIDTRGLPWLHDLEIDVVKGARMTFLGFGAITHALVKGCPQLRSLRLRSNGKIDGQLQAMVEGMLRVGKQKAQVVMCL
jgi:hypothetical protein